MTPPAALILAALLLLPALALAQAPVSASPAPDARQPFPALLASDPSIRLRAVVAMGRERDARVVDGLAVTLRHDRDPEVRARAAWALGRIGAERSVPPLVEALDNDPNRRVQRAVALALGDFEDPRALDALAKALFARDAQVAAAAAEGIGRADSDARRALLRQVSQDKRALVALTARRTLARLPSRDEEKATVGGTSIPAALAALGPCTNGRSPPDCTYRRDRSGGAKADPFFIMGGALLGGLAGGFAPDALRPYRRGVRVSPKRTTDSDNSAAPLERAIYGSLGAGLGAGAAAAWTLIDDVTYTRASLIGLMALEGAALGAAGGLAFGWPRNGTVFSMLGLGAASAVGATIVTYIPHDFSFGDVAFVWTNAAIGLGVGFLTTMVIIPSGVGRPRNRPGTIRDVGEVFGLTDPFLPLPWGEVGRLELAIASGLASSVVASVLTASTLRLYEVSVTRALKTLGAAALGAMLLGLPPVLLFPEPPAPLPNPERVGAAMALMGGLGAGAVTFALSSNDDEQGPLFYFERPGRAEKTATAPSTPSKERRLRQTDRDRIALAPPTVAVVPPLASAGQSGGGVYVGLVNARF